MRRLFFPAFLFALAFLTLIGLGLWQIERLYEKEALLDHIDQALKAAPVSLPGKDEWSRMQPNDYMYRKVSLSGEFDHAHEAHLFGFIVTDERGTTRPGYFILTPLRLDTGDVVFINRGFVPEALKDQSLRRAGLITGRVTLQGLMRAPERKTLFTPEDDVQKNIRFLRDPALLAASLGLPPVAPFIIDADATPVPGGAPEGGHTVISVPNNHLEYALTWFALAFALVGVFSAFVIAHSKSKGTR